MANRIMPNLAMRNAKHWVVLSLLVLSCGGCAEFYTLTVPDHVAPAGSEAPVIVRLQQNDLFFVRMASPDQPIRFRIGEGVERNAHSDKAGYAATLVPMPADPGFYLMEVNLSDMEGDEVRRHGRTYVWDPHEAVVAVDVDFLPTDTSAAAVDALNNLAERGVHLIYMTRDGVSDHFDIHRMLEMTGYPSGPVLSWKREFYRIERVTRFRARVVVEKRLVSQLPQLREMFPNLKAGVCDSTLSAKAFADEGMTVLMIGGDEVPEAADVQRVDWGELGSPEMIVPGMPGVARQP